MTEWAADWDAEHPDPAPVCTCYDPASMEYGPGHPCEYCRVRDAAKNEKRTA